MRNTVMRNRQNDDGALTPISTLDLAGWPLVLKLEGASPSGSHKHRAASYVVARLRRQGVIGTASGPSVELLISSSGNAAYSVAFLTLGTNAKVHVFTDKLSPPEMVERLLALPHVTVRVIDEPDATGSHARARKKALQDYQQKHPRAIDVDQYSQSDWGCGYFSLPAELETQVGDIGSILIAVGTGATLRAIAQYKLKRSLRWPIFAVDALGSALNGEPCGKRVFSGYGNGAQTEWVRQALPHVAEWIRVPDEAVVSASQWLIRRGHFLGPSSCAVLAAASYMISKCRLPHTGRTVLVMPDGGAMYRSTLYNDDFLMEHGFRPSMP